MPAASSGMTRVIGGRHSRLYALESADGPHHREPHRPRPSHRRSPPRVRAIGGAGASDVARSPGRSPRGAASPAPGVARKLLETGGRSPRTNAKEIELHISLKHGASEET